MVPANHAVFGRTAGRHGAARRMAGPSASSRCSETGSANRTARGCGLTSRGIDGSGARSVHHAHRHDLWRFGDRDGGGASAAREACSRGTPGRAAMEAQLKAMRQKSMRAADIATAEKEGFFTGRFAVNPFSGEQVPIWVANFVLAEYGTGAVMCVPAHDQRDYEFAEKYRLPVKIVVQPVQGAPLRADRMNEAYTGIRATRRFRPVLRAYVRAGQGKNGGGRRRRKSSARARPHTG